MTKALPIAIPASVALSNADVLRKEYYQQANSLKYPTHFSQIIYHQQPYGFAPVLKALRPGDQVSLRTTLDEVIVSLGSPAFLLNNSHQITDHMVAFYRKDMGPYLRASQYHFFKGRLAYVESRFLAKGKQEHTTQEVLQKIVRRYAGASGQDHAYQDGDSNRLWVEDGEQLVLHYLSGDAALKSSFPKPNRYGRVRGNARIDWLRNTA
ncbi:MAG TPA: hypothetical protein DCE41_18570 [Cytophagales bacterium]|nr:hypothetical protein [Cytophagales bacterium]HAA17388.1 hypothetical protein [Cytophagales bacterium]HAP61752.1 hypothetical protein [Cytophagales bacterium]